MRDKTTVEGCAPLPPPVDRAATCARQQSNGVALPAFFPPLDRTWRTFSSNPLQAYSSPHYGSTRAICLGTGRQLFVDDFFIESNTLQRVWHEARIDRLAAVRPDSTRPWEMGGSHRRTARPFGAGVHVEPSGERLLLWYRCGWRGAHGRTCVAFSRDGLEFSFPNLGLHGKTNIVLESPQVEAFEVAYDHLTQPPRFLALRMEWMTGGTRVAPYATLESADGVRWRRSSNWTEPLVMADRSTFFLNPLRTPPVWVFSLRENLCQAGPSGHMRARRYWERPHGSRRGYQPFIRDYFQCRDAAPREPIPWFGVDAYDCAYRQCDVYNVDGIAYESILVHGLAILHAPNAGGELKNNSIALGFSRDGFQIARPPPPRHAFIRLPPSTQKSGRRLGLSNAQLASGSPVVSADGSRLLFYFGYGGSTSYVPGSTQSIYGDYMEATGVASLRRDGFVSVAPQKRAEGGTLTTRPLVFTGARLFVNVVLHPRGSLNVEVLSPDADGDARLRLCGLGGTLRGPLNSTRIEVPASHGNGFGAAANRRVRLQFSLTAGELFAFWLTDAADGKSGGYLGGGQLGVRGVVDR